jgi:hypothetical protein
MLSKAKMEGLGLINANFEPCLHQILTSMGMSKKAKRLTKQVIVIQINLNKLTNYTTMWAWMMVTHGMSYDILIIGVVLYPVRVILDFW